MKNRAVFLDKDGTLIQNVPYNTDPEKIAFMVNAKEGLRKLVSAGYLLVIVSNQSGVARGYFSEDQLRAVEDTLKSMIRETSGEELAGFYYCPHHPKGVIDEYAVECTCRKPQPGLLIHAAEDLDIDLGSSWMIGDILDDIEAGKKACCRTILLDSGNETEWKLSGQRVPDYLAVDLSEAANIILGLSTHPAAFPPRRVE